MKCAAFVGGWAHPASRTGPAVARALGSLGHPVELHSTFDGLTNALNGDAVELLVVNTCRFQMTDARYTPAQRSRFASLTPDDFRAAVIRHLDKGRPILAQHTAALCFDDWPEWSSLIGATWDWARSNHPPLGPFVVSVNGHDGAASHAFVVDDELYRNVAPSADATVLASAVDSDDGVEHPVAWRRQHGGSRIAYVSLGHDHRSLSNADHRALLGRTIDWLADSR